MPRYLAVLALVLLVVTVVLRVVLLNRQGIKAFKFGEIDKSDLLIPPFALFYFYLIIANTFGLPTIPGQAIFHNQALSYLGAFLCFLGLAFFLWALISFGKSFRVGIDQDHSDTIVTTGAFALSRNPIYVSFALVLTGQFLIFPSWILLIYLLGALWLFHRQVLREEEFLNKHYGVQYVEYSRRVRRYL